MKIVQWPLKSLTMLAGMFAVLGANITCWWIAHEPEMPEEVKKLQKLQ